MIRTKYRNRYTTISDIYKQVKGKIKKKGKYNDIYPSYKEYYGVISKYFDILIRDLTAKKDLTFLPENMGYLYIEEKENKRAFHIRVDIEKSKKEGKLYKYKVPILDDTYYKVVWKRPHEYRYYKVVPLKKFKNAIKQYCNGQRTKN